MNEEKDRGMGEEKGDGGRGLGETNDEEWIIKKMEGNK